MEKISTVLSQHEKDNVSDTASVSTGTASSIALKPSILPHSVAEAVAGEYEPPFGGLGVVAATSMPLQQCPVLSGRAAPRIKEPYYARRRTNEFVYLGRCGHDASRVARVAQRSSLPEEVQGDCTSGPVDVEL